jgi:hypothetical protein
VRTVVVVVLHEFDEHSLELVPIEDQHPVKALPANGAHETFGHRIGPRSLQWGANDLDAFTAEDFIEAGGELCITVTDEVAERPRSLGEDPDELASLLGDPVPIRVGCDACKMDTPSVVLDEEQDVEPVQEHGLHGEEVTRQQGLGLGPKKRSPARAHPPRRRLDPVTCEDSPDTGGREPYSHLGKLAVDPSVSPGRVLLGHSYNKCNSARGNPRSTRRSWVSPPSAYQLSVPSKQCRWLNEEPRLASSREQPAQASENCTITRTQCRACNLTTQDSNLVSEHDNFDGQIGGVTSLKSKKLKETDERYVYKGKGHTPSLAQLAFDANAQVKGVDDISRTHTVTSSMPKSMSRFSFATVTPSTW